MATDDLVLMGKIAATHGIKGQLRVVSYSGVADNLLLCKYLFVRDAKGGLVRFEVASASVHGKKLLISLQGFSGINQALHLVGSEVLLHKDQLSDPDEGEYYWDDLIGMRVVTTDGVDLGVLESIIETGSNDVYVAVSKGREYLIPALDDIVSIDVHAKLMTVTPFEGLFDL